MLFVYSVTNFICFNAFPENNLQTAQVTVRPGHAPTRSVQWQHLPTVSFLASSSSPFCVRFQHTPPAFVTQSRRVSLRGQKEGWLQYIEFVVPVRQLSLLLIGAIPLWTDTTKSNHVQQDEGTTAVRNVKSHSPSDTASHPRRPESSTLSVFWHFAGSDLALLLQGCSQSRQ